MARRSCSIWLLILIGAPLAVGDDNSGLDVTRVALFSSGVGFFEREAIVSDDARAELKFRTEQINDTFRKPIETFKTQGQYARADSYYSLRLVGSSRGQDSHDFHVRGGT